MTLKQDQQRAKLRSMTNASVRVHIAKAKSAYKKKDAHNQTIEADKKRAQMRHAKSLQHTAPNSRRRKEDLEAIKDYLTRNPPKVW